ncbi:tripartite tricarboxylate transporter substrate binding protein [Verticiella sediminum]
MRALLTLVAAPLWLAAPAMAAQPAAGFPNRPITLVVPFPPGGLTDVSARRLADLAAQELGQPIVVENRPGANGLIGAANVLRAPADGHTLLAVTTSVVLIGPLLTKASFDPLTDLDYILNYAGPSHALVVRADSPYRTLGDLLADAKARPGELSFGTVGTSDTSFFGVSALERAKGVRFNHIPYQGANQSLMAVVSGETTFAPTSNYGEMVKAGKLRPLALLDPQRSSEMPDVPTFTELGIDWQFPWITGIAVSAQTPDAVRRRLEAVFLDAARSDAFGGLLARMSVPLYVLDGDAMKQDLAEKIPQYRQIADEYGLLAQ